MTAVEFILVGVQERGKRAGNKNVPYIVCLVRAAELLTSDDKWSDNAACTDRMRSRLLNRLTMRLSMLPFLREMRVSEDYATGELIIIVG